MLCMVPIACQESFRYVKMVVGHGNQIYEASVRSFKKGLQFQENCFSTIPCMYTRYSMSQPENDTEGPSALVHVRKQILNIFSCFKLSFVLQAGRCQYNAHNTEQRFL